MIIRNANMSLVVRDAADVLQKVTALVDAKGGYVADAKQWKEREQVRASATLRVPATQLMPLLAAIRGFAIRVESENVTAQDVSQEYSDLSAQLRNLQATETELRELLKTVRERTQKASEIMEIYTEITKVRGEIEQIQGRIQYLSQMTSLSTISLELIPDVLAAPVVEPGWQPVATVKNASRSLLNSLKGVVDVLIWVVLYILPLGLIFVVLALIVRWVWRRARRFRGTTT
jgi:predicted RNase H-like nuclease (RuvC/YqgF family)